MRRINALLACAGVVSAYLAAYGLVYWVLSLYYM